MMNDNIKSFTHLEKPYMIKEGGGMGLWRVEYMYICSDDLKEYYGGKAFYYKADAKRYYEEGMQTCLCGNKRELGALYCGNCNA